MLITFDLETLPTNDMQVIAEISASIKPPANYSKQETIVKWFEENGAQAIKDAVAKTSFDGMYGRIACIGFTDDDKTVLATSQDHSEGDAIQLFFDFVGSFDYQITFCGHNVHGFDLPFLKHRAIILGIKPPAQLLHAMSAKPWDNCIADTMLMWSSDPHKRGSMDRLCKAFGIQGKDGFDGSMVAETWPVDPQKVIEYCKDDVERTRKIYKRINFI